ncbi:MAG: YihY/virulence factor BrkB family protein, partial [Gluconacetobacter diazotrophicus]|nr:YihY/virulence factor BrkB family protein [Gluconacetobacter diazotrophicus]
LLTSLWSSNNGIKSLFEALNVVFREKEERSFVRFTLTAFAFTFGGIAFLLFAVSAVVALPVVLNFVGFENQAGLVLRVLRWPLLLLVLMVGLSATYRFGPSRNEARWEWITWGGAVAAVGWLAVSFGFSYYVANFGSYNKTYGSLGAVIGFMTWIWISSIVVLMGGALNAELLFARRRREGRDTRPVASAEAVA